MAHKPGETPEASASGNGELTSETPHLPESKPMATRSQARLSNITRMVACPMILGGGESGTRRVFAVGFDGGGRYMACCLAAEEGEDPRGDLRKFDGLGRWNVKHTADADARLDQTIAQYNTDERWGQCVEI